MEEKFSQLIECENEGKVLPAVDEKLHFPRRLNKSSGYKRRPRR